MKGWKIIGVFCLLTIGMTGLSLAEKNEVNYNGWPTFTHPRYYFQFQYPPDYEVSGVNRFGCWIIKKGKVINVEEDMNVRPEGFSLCEPPNESECGFERYADHLAVHVVCSGFVPNSSSCGIVKDKSELKLNSGLRANKYSLEFNNQSLPSFYVVNTTRGERGSLVYIWTKDYRELHLKDDIVSKIVQSITLVKPNQLLQQ